MASRKPLIFGQIQKTDIEKLNSHIVATYECHRCLAPSNGDWRRDSPFGQKKDSSKRSKVLQISPVDAEKYKLLGRVQLGEHRAPLAAWRGSTVASRRSARGARCALGLGPGLLHGYRIQLNRRSPSSGGSNNSWRKSCTQLLVTWTLV